MSLWGNVKVFIFLAAVVGAMLAFVTLAYVAAILLIPCMIVGFIYFCYKLSTNVIEEKKPP